MPEISENAGDLYREAARNTLRHVEQEDAALSYLLLHLDNDFTRAEQLIRQMLEKRDQWLRHTGAKPDFAAVRAALEASLEERILDHLECLRDQFDREAAVEVALLCGFEKFPDAAIGDLPAWRSVADLLSDQAGVANGRKAALAGHPQTRAAERADDVLRETLKGEFDFRSRHRNLPSRNGRPCRPPFPY